MTVIKGGRERKQTRLEARRAAFKPDPAYRRPGSNNRHKSMPR